MSRGKYLSLEEARTSGKIDRFAHDLQARTSRREKLASPPRPQPVAESHPRCKVQRRNRGRQIASSSRCRLTLLCMAFVGSSHSWRKHDHLVGHGKGVGKILAALR